MYNVFALLIAGAVLAMAGTAFAGEPTGRYQGAVGSLPEGVEQVYFDNGTNGYYTAAAAEAIPAATNQESVTVALRNVGRALVVTANVPGSVSEVQLASRQ